MKTKYIIHRLQDDELEHRHWDESKTVRDKNGQIIMPGWVSDEENVPPKTKSSSPKSVSRIEVEETTPPKTKSSSPKSVSRTEVAASVATASAGILRGVQNVSNEASKLPVEKGTTQHGSYPDISDKELKQRVNRLQLEQRYSDLKGDTKYVKSGSEKTREVMQTIGSVAGIGASIAVAVGAIMGLFKSKSPATPPVARP